jgi:hypothetical protein
MLVSAWMECAMVQIVSFDMSVLCQGEDCPFIACLECVMVKIVVFSMAKNAKCTGKKKNNWRKEKKKKKKKKK